MSINKISFSIFTLIVITFLSKFTGFFREIIIAAQFGINEKTDAFYLATSIPLLLFSGITLSLGSVFIPKYIEISNEKSEKIAKKYTMQILKNGVLLSVVLSLFTFLFSETIVSIVSAGASELTQLTATKYLKLLSWLFSFFFVSAVLTSYLQIKDHSTYAAGTIIPANILLVLVAIYFNEDLYNLIVATFLGFVLQLILLCLLAAKEKLNIFKNEKKLKNEYLRKNILSTFTLMFPLFLSTSFQNINIFVDKFLAAGFPEGSISFLNYADRLNGFVFGIIATSVATVIFPLLSSAINRKENFNETLKYSINVISVITIPITIIVLLFSPLIVNTLFQSDLINQSDRNAIGELLKYYSLAMVFLGYREILNKVFFSLGDVKTPFLNSIYTVSINIVLSIILSSFLGLKGIVLATSLSTIFTFVFLVTKLKKNHNITFSKKLLYNTFLVLCINIVVFLIMKIIFEIKYDLNSSIFAFVVYLALSIVIVFIMLEKFNVFSIKNLIKMRGIKN